MIIFTGITTRIESVNVCTACYMQQPVALHKIFVTQGVVEKCDICGEYHTKLRTIIAYISSHSRDGRTITGRAHYILSDVGFYRVILIDRLKKNTHDCKP